jgi:hypothetical protein
MNETICWSHKNSKEEDKKNEKRKLNHATENPVAFKVCPNDVFLHKWLICYKGSEVKLNRFLSSLFV